MTRTRLSSLTLTAVALTTVAVSLSGCGGGGDGGSKTDSAASLQQTRDAQVVLNGLVAGGTAPTSDSLHSVSSQFASAYFKDPNNAQAAFGYGVTDIAYNVQLAVDTLSKAQKIAAKKSVKHTNVSRASSNIASISLAGPLSRALFWKSSRLTDLKPTGLIKATAAAPFALAGVSRAADAQTAAQLHNLLLVIDTALDRDIALIARGNTSGFGFDVANFNQGGTGTLTIDQADVQALLAGLYGVRAIANGALAYDVNFGSYNTDQTISDAFPNLAVGGTLTPAQYLPGGNFGTLLSGGATNLASAKTYLNTAADLLLGLPNTVDQRSTQSNHLLDGSQITQSDLTQFTNAVTTLKSALSGPYTDPDTGITINLNAIFSNPPADLFDFAPTYAVVASGSSYELVTNKSGYVDPTFGGLLQNVPDAAYSSVAFPEDGISILISNILNTDTL